MARHALQCITHSCVLAVHGCRLELFCLPAVRHKFKVAKPELLSDWKPHRAAVTVTLALKQTLFTLLFCPPHSCEPSLDSHIKIIEVLVTSEWSDSQAAPGNWLLYFRSIFHPSQNYCCSYYCGCSGHESKRLKKKCIQLKRKSRWKGCCALHYWSNWKL